MHVLEVKSYCDFNDFMYDLLDTDAVKNNSLPLEEFLRALWYQILQNKHIAPSWTLFAWLLK